MTRIAANGGAVVDGTAEIVDAVVRSGMLSGDEVVGFIAPAEPNGTTGAELSVDGVEMRVRFSF